MWNLLKQKRLFGDAFWALAGQIVSALALLVGTRMLTELVSPETFGQVALLNGFVALGVAVFSYPFICAGMRLTAECRNYRERVMLNKVVSGLTAKSTMLAIVLLMLGGATYSYFRGGEIGLFALTGLLLAVTVRRELGIQLLIGERKQRGAALWQTSDSLLRPLLAIWLVWGLGGNPESVLLGYVLASVASNTLWAIVNGDREEKRPANLTVQSGQFRRNIWAYALPLIPMELIFWLNGLGDRYVIGYLLTAAEVGLYAATYTIVNEAFSRSAMVLLRTFQPAYFQSFSAGHGKEAFLVLWMWIASVLGLGLLGVALVWVCKDWVATLLLAKSYHAAVELMPAIAAGSALSAVGTVVAQPLLARKRTQAMLRGRICGALAAAICLPLMVSHFGLMGAALANPIYFGIEALVLALLAKPWRRAPISKFQMVAYDFESLTEKPAILSAESCSGQ